MPRFIRRCAVGLWLAAVLIATCPPSHAQAPSQAPGQLAEFEVASVKPNKSNERMYYGLRNATMTVRNISAKGLIQIAYGKRDFEISGGPAWVASECFDIVAKAERPQKATTDMLKSLLAARFQLKLHSETKETAVYAVTVAKGGLKMKLSADQSEPEKGGPREMGPGRIIGDGVPMYIIVNLLSNMLGRAVVNDTRLTGKYDVDLRPVADSLRLEPGTADPLAQGDTVKLAIIDAVEQQLGLKMESRKGPDQILVIDHIERPSAN